MFALLQNKTKLILILIVIFGGLIRFIGANPGFNQYHSDEGISYSAAVSMIKDKDLDPLRYDYPALVPEINYIAFKTTFIPLYWIKYYATNLSRILDGYEKLIPTAEDYKRIFQHDILGDREVNALFWGRYTTALVSILSIILIFFLGKRLANSQVGLIAAFLLAINFRSVTNSHIGLPDTYNAFFVMLSLLLSYRLLKNRTTRDYILAGLGIGLSLATKYQTFIVLPFLFMHFFEKGVPFSFREKLRLALDKRLYIAGLTAGFVFFVINPYLLIHLEESLAWVSSVSTKYAMGRDVLNLFPLHYWVFVDYGPILFSFVILGLLTFFKNKRIESLFLTFELLPFLFVMLYYSVGGFYVRNFITITPIYLLFAAYFLWLVFEFLKKKRSELYLVIGLLVLTVVGWNSMKNVFFHTINYMRPWNYQTIVTEAKKVIPTGSTVIGHPFDPLPTDINLKRIPISATELYSLSEMRLVNSDYALINLDWAADPFYGWMTRGFPENISYVLHKPYEQMRETFWGLSIEEMMQSVVGSRYKPWQAPEADLFIVQIPKYGVQKYASVMRGDFETVDKVWAKEDPDDSSDTYLTYDSKRHAIQIGPGSGTFNISRFSSSDIPVKPGFVYKLQAALSSDSVITSEKRNVFLRVNYFNTNNKKLLTSVSPRYYGKELLLSFESHAPEFADHMTLSLQAANALGEAVFMKNWEVFESDQQITFDKLKVVPFEEYKDILYPNSHGNL